MADSTAQKSQGGKEEVRDTGNEAAERRPLPGAALPLRPSLLMGMKSQVDGTKDTDSMSTRSGASKAVSIAAEPESIPTPSHRSESHTHKHQVSAGIGKRLSGRPTSSHNSSKLSLKSQNSFEELPAAALAQLAEASAAQKSHRHGSGHHHHERLLKQVSDWLQTQKAKSAAKRAIKGKGKKRAAADEDISLDDIVESPAKVSEDSDASSISLGDLEKILEASMSISSAKQESPRLAPRRPSYSLHKKPSSRRLSKAASSDTEFFDGDAVVPSCDVVLDNSKTLGFSGGAAASEISLPAAGNRADKEAKAWNTFKSEILRLAHTLRLKGWRRVPLESGADIEVERLSGALTNAVYVVSPPKNMPQPKEGERKLKKPPAKLLLRIYGPQVEHLIDRETELAILRRLARKKIGPRMLGTFRNGRFEEYFESTTLTPNDLRVPETSKQIAKRMRELHDGIELLEKERDEGPFVWRNWDKWVERCEHVIKFLDHQIVDESARRGSIPTDSWMHKGFVCGVEWKMFRKMVEEYRKWLYEKYGGVDGLRSELVFAHNDTQYGNILRLLPTTSSPLLLPSNSHKQLVVIDFEYASANTPGLEFANHFTEWCYNYHDAVAPEACNTRKYPTVEEQKRFIRAYLEHRPQFVASASATPKARPSPGPGSVSGTAITSFMLDARTPAGVPSNYVEEEKKREEQVEKQVDRLMMETRLWRVANSAQWVAWGIVQANVPELDELDEKTSTASGSPAVDTPVDSEEGGSPMGGLEGQADGTAGTKEESCVKEDVNAEEEEEEEFDYIGYAQDRALFFWGDCVDLGLVKREELPEGLRERIKIIGY